MVVSPSLIQMAPPCLKVCLSSSGSSRGSSSSWMFSSSTWGQEGGGGGGYWQQVLYESFLPQLLDLCTNDRINILY